MASGYNLVEVHPGHRYDAVFQISFGLFEYIALPLGLRNAPATFQILISSILNEALDKICTIHLNIILMLFTTLTEYLNHIE